MQYKSQISTPSKYGQHIIRITEAVIKSFRLMPKYFFFYFIFRAFNSILICLLGHLYISSSIFFILTGSVLNKASQQKVNRKYGKS